MVPFLTDTQRIEYRHLHKKSKEKQIADRMKSILWLDAGVGFDEVAKLLMIDEVTPRRWYQQYEEGGIEKLLKDEYKGSEPHLSKVQQFFYPTLFILLIPTPWGNF